MVGLTGSILIVVRQVKACVTDDVDVMLAYLESSILIFLLVRCTDLIINCVCILS